MTVCAYIRNPVEATAHEGALHLMDSTGQSIAVYTTPEVARAMAAAFGAAISGQSALALIPAPATPPGGGRLKHSHT